MRDLACVIHVHSTWSDGTGTVPQIMRAAAKAGVDVVLLTDHDTLAARDHGQEGWHGDVLLLVGEEVTPHDNHYLAFGIDEVIRKNGRSPAPRPILDLRRDARWLVRSRSSFRPSSRRSAG